jgi:hypothetical protein
MSGRAAHPDEEYRAFAGVVIAGAALIPGLTILAIFGASAGVTPVPWAGSSAYLDDRIQTYCVDPRLQGQRDRLRPCTAGRRFHGVTRRRRIDRRLHVPATGHHVNGTCNGWHRCVHKDARQFRGDCLCDGGRSDQKACDEKAKSEHR